MAALFQVPTRQDVSENNQAIFEQLNKGLGFVPNLYAYYAKSATALGDAFKDKLLCTDQTLHLAMHKSCNRRNQYLSSC